VSILGFLVVFVVSCWCCVQLGFSLFHLLYLVLVYCCLNILGFLLGNGSVQRLC